MRILRMLNSDKIEIELTDSELEDLRELVGWGYDALYGSTAARLEPIAHQIAYAEV